MNHPIRVPFSRPVRLLCLAAVSLLLFSCTGESSPSDDSPVVLRFSLPVSRTVLPGTSLEVARFELRATGPAGKSLEVSASGDILRASLEPGNWLFEVTARNAASFALYFGSATALVEPSSVLNLTIPLADIAGTGAFTLSVVPPADQSPSVEIVLAALDGTPVETRSVGAPYAPSSWPALPAGYYAASARIPGLAAGFSEVIRVISGAATLWTADFSSLKASLSLSCPIADSSPLEPLLPSWRDWSAIVPIPLSVRGAKGLPLAALSRYLADGSPAANPENGILLPAGGHRVDVVAWNEPGSRAGSGSRGLDISAGNAGTWVWRGNFAADADLAAALPAGNGFASIAVPAPAFWPNLSAGAPFVLALDAPSSGSAVSTIHRFVRDAAGNLFPSGLIPVRTGGTARKANRLVLSPDGSRALVWNVEGSVLGVYELSSGLCTAVDAATLGLSETLKVRDARFSTDGGSIWLLSGSPYRIFALAVESPDSAPLWARSLAIAELGTSSINTLVPGASGSLLLLSSSGDAAILLGDRDASPVLLRKATASWLESPSSAVSCPDGSFLVLASGATGGPGSVGRLSCSGDAASGYSISAYGLSAQSLSALTEIALSPDGSVAVSGAKSGVSRAVFLAPGDSPSGLGDVVSVEASADVPGLEASMSPCWAAGGELLLGNGAARILSSFRGQ